MAYTLRNKCAKNLCKRTVFVQLIIENVVTCFLRHSVYSVGQIKRGQLTFSFVTGERIYKIK